MSLLWTWALGLALAGEPGDCSTSLRTPPDNVSVAWISPLGAQARGKQWLVVAPTAELRSWQKAHRSAGTGELLQALGLRKRAVDPKKPWKIVIFDTTKQGLCRPMEGMEPPAVQTGVAVCEARLSTPASADGCGRTVDHSTGKAGLQVYRSQWNALASGGFCVLPIERFLQGG